VTGGDGAAPRPEDRAPAEQGHGRTAGNSSKTDDLERDRADLLDALRLRAPECLAVFSALDHVARGSDVIRGFPTLRNQTWELVASATQEQLALATGLSRHAVRRRLVRLHRLAFIRLLVRGASFPGRRGWASRWELALSPRHRVRWLVWRRRHPEGFNPTLRKRDSETDSEARMNTECARAPPHRLGKENRVCADTDAARGLSAIRSKPKENRVCAGDLGNEHRLCV